MMLEEVLEIDTSSWLHLKLFRGGRGGVQFENCPPGPSPEEVIEFS